MHCPNIKPPEIIFKVGKKKKKKKAGVGALIEVCQKLES